jgi:hypothetical protein
MHLFKNNHGDYFSVVAKFSFQIPDQRTENPFSLLLLFLFTLLLL